MFVKPANAFVSGGVAKIGHERCIEHESNFQHLPTMSGPFSTDHGPGPSNFGIDVRQGMQPFRRLNTRAWQLFRDARIADVFK